MEGGVNKKAAAITPPPKLHGGRNGLGLFRPYQSKHRGALAARRKLWASSTSTPALIAEFRAKAAWGSMMPAIALDEVITTTSAAATISFTMSLSPIFRSRHQPRRSPWEED